jgi:hypothetical protein
MRACKSHGEAEGARVQGPFDAKRHVPLIDLGTVRETLAYIRDDLQRVPDLERAAELVASALGEIAAAERRRLPRSILDAWLMPRRRH